MRMLLALAVTGALLACEKPGFDPPDRAARVQEAELAYSPAMFDTIDWLSDEEKLTTGNEVYVVHCRNCHGPLGEGDTPYARSRDLDVRSLVEPEWEYAGDVAAVRRRIFTGHPAGMYTWGIAGISPREIDAVAHYILERLRPDAHHWRSVP